MISIEEFREQVLKESHSKNIANAMCEVFDKVSWDSYDCAKNIRIRRNKSSFDERNPMLLFNVLNEYGEENMRICITTMLNDDSTKVFHGISCYSSDFRQLTSLILSAMSKSFIENNVCSNVLFTASQIESSWYNDTDDIIKNSELNHVDRVIKSKGGCDIRVVTLKK